MVNGVDRDPGEQTACVTPQRTNVSTNTLHQSELVFLKSNAGSKAVLMRGFPQKKRFEAQSYGSALCSVSPRRGGKAGVFSSQ
jgi:hypothetical protein